MLKKEVFLTLAYYSLNRYPLTFVELVKFLASPRQPAPEEIFAALGELISEKKITAQGGFYFLPTNQDPVALRIDHQKLKVEKTRRLKRKLKLIALTPFVRLVGLSGSFNLDNSKKDSDFDLLIIASKNRLWSVRFFLTVLTLTLGWKRQPGRTADRICLNCFMTEDSLEITPGAKKRDFHSAQEYARLIPLAEEKPGLFESFRQKNLWLKEFVGRYPWPLENNFLKIKTSRTLRLLKKTTEVIFNFLGGNFFERALGKAQKKRIHAQRPTDQIFCSNCCLMLHPSSKSFKLLEELGELEKNF